MKLALIAILTLHSISAAADPKVIEALVRKNVDGLAKLHDDDKLGFSTSSVVIGPNGRIDMSANDGCVSGAVANSMYGCLQAGITHKVGAVTVSMPATGGVAWFQAPYTVTLTAEDDEGKPSASKTEWRVGGIAVSKGKAWEIVAAMYVTTISDKELLAGTGGKPASGQPSLAGDKKIAGVVAGWFSSGFAGAAAKTGTLVASGTSPTEFKTAVAATQLAKSWDALKLGATKIEATSLANGAIAWVRADVKMPRKSKGAVSMTLFAIVIPEGTSWKWVSLQYQPEFQLGR